MERLTSKERVELTLQHKKPDRVPFNFWMDRRLLGDYEKKYGEYFRVQHYGGDVIESFLVLQWPKGEGIERDGTYWVTKPLWSDGWRGVQSVNWPDPTDPNNLSIIRKDIKNQPDKAIFVNVPGVLCVLHELRSESDLYMDFFERPDDVEELFNKIGEVMAESVTVLCERCPDITAVYVQDDVCSTQGMMFSDDILQRFIFMANDQPIRAAIQAGKKVVYHSDGFIMDLIEHLIQLGVSAVNPLQPNLHRFKDFAERFGGRIGVYGGMDNMFIIPDGTTEELRRHILHGFNTLGKNGGLILSSHDIPPHCPKKNIETMVRIIREECVYE